jgi:hypothetical protein
MSNFFDFTRPVEVDLGTTPAIGGYGDYSSLYPLAGQSDIGKTVVDISTGAPENTGGNVPVETDTFAGDLSLENLARLMGRVQINSALVDEAIFNRRLPTLMAIDKIRSDRAFGQGMLKTGFASIIKDIPKRAAEMAQLRADVGLERLKQTKRDLRPQRVAQNYFTGAPIGTYKARGF